MSRNLESTERSRSQPGKSRLYRHLYPSRTLAEENMSFALSTKSRTNNLQHELNKPQRIELPVYFNTPRRFGCSTRSSGTRAFSNSRGSVNTSFLNISNIESDQKVCTIRRLRDYSMLAFACKRGGKARDEGRAYYSMGVLYDNLENYHKAIASYQQFLTVCKTIGDNHGEALAYNCIGVDYHKLAERQPEIQNLWQEAINYHNKHKEIADVPGKFLAHINLGIVYSAMGDEEMSSVNHQMALKYAIQMSSVAGQSVAIGNLGKIGNNKLVGDTEKLKMFAERYLSLSHELKNKKGESGAYQQLGNISFKIGDYDTSTKSYYRALKIAEEIGDKEMAESALCNLGVSNASMKMESYMNNILNRIQTYRNSTTR
jgi:tetratricopeptide (TPR) repeat protein